MDSYVAAFNAAWEIDLWGRIRRQNEAARARFFATQEARRGVTLSVISAVAAAYFELLELDDELDIAKRTADSFDHTLKLFNDRLEHGVASALETSRAEAALASVTAAIPELERQIALKENEISVLLGQNPHPISRSKMLLDQSLPPEVPAGLSSSLLERRPDIREAEQLLRAANAQVGVAVGDFFPKIGLTGLYGGVSTELSTLTGGGANMWSMAANVSGPLFEGGRLYGQYRQTKGAWEEARVRYRQTALTAFREVSDALISHQKLGEARAQQARAVSAYQQAVEVSSERYVNGKAGYFEVLEAQQQLFPSENTLARIELNRRLVIVQLYRSLGGGWESSPK
jgi:multidrug efflux system outer membrane protein